MRALDFDARRLRRATTRPRCAFLAERCERVLTATFPLDLGRPRAGRLAEGNAAVERNARAAGALLLDLRDFGARNLVMADHVHPTAFGQVAIAERALAVLAADGMAVRARPSALIAPSEPSRRCGACRATPPTPTGTRRCRPAPRRWSRASGCALAGTAETRAVADLPPRPARACGGAPS